ncbi:MAG: hypothetical protein AB1831_11820 [Pseudomonadota bacterium]
MRTTQMTIALGLACLLAAVPTSYAAAQDDAVPEAGDPAEAPTPAKAKKKAKGKKKAQGVWKVKLDEARLSADLFTGDSAPDTMANLFASVSAGMQSGAWEYALGLRADAQVQGGNPDFSRGRLDYAENYARWRGEDRRITVGAQNVLWGRVDEISPIDRMSRVDLTRLVLDKQPERRRAVPAVRWEEFLGDYKLDAVWLPAFDAAVMPHLDSAWHPVDTVAGRVLGIGSVPLAIGAAVREDAHGSGGGGVRLTRAGGGVDYGLSVQRVRQSLPYYRIGAGTLTGVHPYTWVVGGELETQKAGATWRMEAAWSSDVPVTFASGQMGLQNGWDVVLGTEFFPGDAETRVTLQLAGHKTLVHAPILDRDEVYALTGEVEHPFAQGRWRFNLRFVSGLGERDIYLNPRLAYLGIDQHEFYLAGHAFSGTDKSLGGYYQDKDLIEVGWRARF